MLKKQKFKGLPPVTRVHKEINNVMRFFEQIPHDSRAEVASLLCFGVIAGVSQGDYNEGKNIFDNAKSKFLDIFSNHKSKKAKTKLKEQKENYQRHNDGTPCFYGEKKYGMNEEDKEKYLSWSSAECKAVEEFARMSLDTLQEFQEQFEEHAQKTFEIHNDSTYIVSENMPQAPFGIYCKSGKLMDSFRRLALMFGAAIDRKNKEVS